MSPRWASVCYICFTVLLFIIGLKRESVVLLYHLFILLFCFYQWSSYPYVPIIDLLMWIHSSSFELSIIGLFTWIFHHWPLRWICSVVPFVYSSFLLLPMIILPLCSNHWPSNVYSLQFVEWTFHHWPLKWICCSVVHLFILLFLLPMTILILEANHWRSNVNS